MSQLSFDADLLPRLEALYRTVEILRRRRIVRETLAAAPGERILDVGCGPGFYAADLLEDVGPSGSIVGVDRSPQMLGAARQRNEAKRNASFLEGEATAPPVEDGSFDAALCVQVLEYVPDTVAALTAMRRALRPGGRLLVWDVDWSTVSLHSTDPARTARVLEAWDGHSRTRPCRGPRGARSDRSDSRTSELRVTRSRPSSTSPNVLRVDDRADGGLRRRARRLRARRGSVRGRTTCRSCGRRGEFFLALTQFCFTAR